MLSVRKSQKKTMHRNTERSFACCIISPAHTDHELIDRLNEALSVEVMENKPNHTPKPHIVTHISEANIRLHYFELIITSS